MLANGSCDTKRRDLCVFEKCRTKRVYSSTHVFCVYQDQSESLYFWVITPLLLGVLSFGHNYSL
jgi:hypothetical protein